MALSKTFFHENISYELPGKKNQTRPAQQLLSGKLSGQFLQLASVSIVTILKL